MKGEQNKKILERDSNVIGDAMCFRSYPMVIKEAKGCEIRDIEGNSYLDFCGMNAVASTGHCHSTVLKVINEELTRLTSSSFASYSTLKPVELAEKLIQYTPGDFKKKVIFGLSGTDVNDYIFKIMPYYTNRKKFLSFIGSYHGMTMGSLNLSGHRCINKFSDSNTVLKVPYAYCYRCPFTLEYPKCSLHCVDFIKNDVFSSLSRPEDVSCLIVEPIESDGGEIVPPKDFLPKLRKICDDYGIMMAVDEIKTGFGRTGRMFCTEHMGVIPDIVTLGKPIASGMPLSACVGPADLLDSAVASHLITIGGYSASCAAALATLDIIEQEDLVSKTERLGYELDKRLKEMKQDHEIIGDVRGQGLMFGLELVKNVETKKPAPEETIKICYRSWQLGLLLVHLGIYSNVVEITPPLIITREELGRGLTILDQAIRDVEAGKVQLQEYEHKRW